MCECLYDSQYTRTFLHCMVSKSLNLVIGKCIRKFLLGGKGSYCQRILVSLYGYSLLYCKTLTDMIIFLKIWKVHTRIECGSSTNRINQVSLSGDKTTDFLTRLQKQSNMRKRELNVASKSVVRSNCSGNHCSTQAP